MSRMFSTKDWVPGGTFVHDIAGDKPSPVATPGAAWLNLTGMSAPSANPETVSVIAGGGGAPPRWPRSCAASGATASRTIANNAHRWRACMADDSSLTDKTQHTRHETERQKTLERDVEFLQQRHNRGPVVRVRRPHRRGPRVDRAVALRAGRDGHDVDRRRRTALPRQRERGPLAFPARHQHVDALHV